MHARDLAELFGYALLGLPARTIYTVWGGRGLRRYARILGALPIVPDADGWAPMDWRDARPRDWRIVVAARAGLPCHPAAVPGVEMRSAETSTCFGMPTAKGWRTVRAYEALHGREIVDLVAWVPDWKGEPLRPLLGEAIALGDTLGREPEEEPPDADDDGAGPVPISPDLAHWLRHAARGAILPLGDLGQRRDYLRGLACGLIAASPKHAAELRRTMKRDPVPPPPIPDVWLEAADPEQEAA